jgi:hypothetical protein
MIPAEIEATQKQNSQTMRLRNTCTISPDADVIEEFTAALLAALEPVWEDHEFIAVRSQFDGELRTKIGQELRQSSEWIDGRKTRRKMVGTAGFAINDMDHDEVAKVAKAMIRWGYYVPGWRIVVIGGPSAWGEDMPEHFALAVVDAKLLAVVGIVEQAPQ